MFDEQDLDALTQQLGWPFDNIDLLKHNIALFCHHYGNLDSSAIPFSDTLQSSDTTPSLANTLRVKKGLFIVRLYQCITHIDGSLSEEKRGILYKEMEKSDAAIWNMLENLKLANYLSASKADPIYTTMLAHFSLFIIEAVLHDALDHQKNPAAVDWLAKQIKTLYDVNKRAEFPELCPSPFDLFNPSLHNSAAQRRPFRPTPFLDDDDMLGFESTILKFNLPTITQSLPLPKLIDKFPDASQESIDRFYSQWLPYIIEEEREAIASQYQLIDRQHLRYFNITLTKKPVLDEQRGTVECVAETSQLPKLDHGFAMEALLLRPTRPSADLPSELLAIANVKYDKKDPTKRNRTTSLRVIVLTESLKNYPKFFEKNVQWQAHWLAGLIPAARGYEACLLKAPVSFINDIVTATLTPLPEQDQVTTLQVLPLQSILNPSQFEAVSRFYAAKSGQNFLQGPPGTGKTTTIVHLLRALANDPTRRIMVCAPTNEAVHVLAKRSLELMESHVKMALTGIAKELSPELKSIYINDYAEDLCDAMTEECLDTFSAFHEILIKQLEAAQPVGQRDHDSFEQASEKLYGFFIEAKKLCGRLLEPSPFHQDRYAQNHIESLKEEVSVLTHQIDRLLNDYKAQVNACIAKLQSKQFRRLPLAFPTLNEARAIQSTKVDLKKEDPKPYIDQLNIIQAQYLGLLGELIKAIYKNREAIEILSLQRSQIIFCTLVASGRKWLHKHIKDIDTLIIDEAAQVVVPHTLIPYSYMPRTCLQVGDWKQLGAVVSSKAAQANDYGRPMMTRLGASQNDFQMLEEQYRMHEDICRWPSLQHYSGRLRAHHSLLGRPSPLAGTGVAEEFLKPCVFFHVAGEENRRGGELTQSINNVDEATALINALTYLLQFLDPSQIGVITFYSAQVVQLKEQASKSRNPRMRDVKISTVDGFQGQEKDVIVISTVRTCESAGFLRGEQGEQRINVAATRARHHLYFFGQAAILRRSNTDFADLIPHYESEQNTGCAVVAYRPR